MSLPAPVLLAQLDIFVINVPVIVDFEQTFTGVNEGAFAGGGFAPSPATGQLDSDAWEVAGMSDGNLDFGQSNVAGDFARGTHSGGVGTGGIYAFEVGSNLILGVQPGASDFTPGSLTLKAVNMTGDVIEDLQVEYTIWELNNADRSNSLNFEWSLNGTSFTMEPSLDFNTTEAAAGSPSWMSTSRSITLAGVNLPSGDDFFFNWNFDDASGSGSRDEHGIDNITLTASGPGRGIPEPASWVTYAGIAVMLLALCRRIRRHRSQLNGYK